MSLKTFVIRFYIDIDIVHIINYRDNAFALVTIQQPMPTDRTLVNSHRHENGHLYYS